MVTDPRAHVSSIITGQHLLLDLIATCVAREANESVPLSPPHTLVEGGGALFLLNLSDDGRVLTHPAQWFDSTAVFNIELGWLGKQTL